MGMHTGVMRGKRVYVKTKSGARIVDKFMGRTDKAITLKQHGKIRKRDIQSFSIYRADTGKNHKGKHAR